MNLLGKLFIYYVINIYYILSDRCVFGLMFLMLLEIF